MLAELRGSEHARGDPRRGELRPIRRDWTRSSVTGTAPLKHVWRARIVAAVEQIRHSRLDNRARTARLAGPIPTSSSVKTVRCNGTIGAGGVDMIAVLTACPSCDGRWLFVVFTSGGPIVISWSCVRVRRIERRLREPLLNLNPAVG